MADKEPQKCRQCGNMGEVTRAGVCGSCLMKDELDWVHEPEVTKAHVVALGKALRSMIALYDSGDTHNDLVVDAARKVLDGGKR